MWSFRREKLASFFGLALVAGIWNSLVFWVFAGLVFLVISAIEGAWTFDWNIAWPIWLAVVVFGYLQLIVDEWK